MTIARNLTYKNERWFLLLQAAVKESSVTAVAARLSAGYSRTYSRTAVSLVIAEKYPAKTDKIAARVIELFDRWQCPYLNTDITGEDCRAIHSGPTPSHDPARLSHRRVCRTCTHNGGKL